MASEASALRCQWVDCSETFDGAEQLFQHLCDQHVGRKSSGNLSLTCFWKGCNTTCSKRDHITSHMRVHTPLKPHACTTCGKAFKRPQDLRKHEKIHTEEHHARHKQSKAITIPSLSSASAAAASSITAKPELNGHHHRQPGHQSQHANGGAPAGSTYPHAYPHQQQPQQLHPQALGGLNPLLAAQQQQRHQQPHQNAHLMKPPHGAHHGMEVSPGPPSALNPHSVGNALHPQAHNPNIQASVSPPGTANPAANGNFFPFMLPYPYAGYGLPTAEQQAGLAELLLQQQRLNAAAAQLIGMPSQLQQQSSAPPANHPFNGVTPGAIPPYSLLFPGLLGGFQNGTQQQLYQNYQQQYGQFGAAQPSPQPHMQQPAPPQHPQQSRKASGGMYPDLDNLMKNENMPPAQHPHQSQIAHYTASTGHTSSSSRTNGSSSFNTHTRSDSSNGASPVSSHNYTSVSPQPPAYMPSRHHPDYIAHANQQHYAYSNTGNDNSAAHLFQKSHQSQNHSAGNTVLGKGKRGFESEADTLLNDLKKKRYDGTNGSQFEQRLDNLSSYLFDSDPTFSEAYSTSLPSVTVDSTQSPSDRSSHSSTSNFSPRSASGSIKSPAEAALDLSKSDIDDINNLLFSFGQPYESPAGSNDIVAPKNAISWPTANTNQPVVNSDFAPVPNFNANGHQSSTYVDFIADSDKTSPASTVSNATSTQQLPPNNTNNTHIYPSLSGLSADHANKQMKSLPHSSMQGGYIHQHQPLSMPLQHIAQARPIPTPYIAADTTREPQMTTIPLLSRAPPTDRLPPIRLLSDETAPHHLLHKSGGVSSLRSTMTEDDKSEHSSEGRNEEEEAALQLHRFHTQRESTSSSMASPEQIARTMSEEEEDGDKKITLPPIGQPDHRGSECHLPSLRSLLANEPVEHSSRYEARHRPSASIATTISEAASEPVSSSPSTTGSAMSFSQSNAQKRATPSRQFYPSLSSLAMRDEPASYASTSTSSSSAPTDIQPSHSYYSHHARPSTGDKLDRITRGVHTFRMDSYDEEDGGTKSESDDDMSPDAVYKRSRQRTRGPTPPAFSSGSVSARITRSPSALTEDDELASDLGDGEEDVKPVVSSMEYATPSREQIIHKKRLAVIHALVARANALYREQMARKRHYPALIRVKEEEME